ncbi:hypothetical protein [Microbispora hainanensis]|uniref:Tetratricopeptide repeat protein n=1 Tax=Microbispora hainanensis TaxID=568844 RepID=A0A544YKL8_9ACTN|nr:hypothetical protein [Microbispora hainanensis]TQS17247.1 hypothetical protein FLX08_30225 [Microbispora hainanensis]
MAGGWLSLLAATCLIDLRRFPAAAARLRTAAQFAKDTEHQEIAAWRLETEAWQLLTTGDYRRALELAADQPEEAGHAALTAITSGLLVPSNYWRAAEVIRALEARCLPEAAELHEAYQELCSR